MTFEEAIKVRDFAVTWITKVVAKRKDYRERLVNALYDLFPEDKEEGGINYDSFAILDAKNWDFGERDEESNSYYSGMGDLLTQLIEWDNIYSFTSKAKNDFICAIRIAMDLLIRQSGGVTGFTVGDLKEVFGGEIPSNICEMYKADLNNANEEDTIWL